MKNKSKNVKIAFNDIDSTLIKKEQIKTKLNEIRDKHLKDLINYEISLLYRTELANQKVKEKLIQKYPKTFSRMSFNFSPLFNEFDAELVDVSILEILESLDAKDFESERNQPFLRFEYYIKQEAKEKARVLFNDFVKQNQL